MSPLYRVRFRPFGTVGRRIELPFREIYVVGSPGTVFRGVTPALVRAIQEDLVSDFGSLGWDWVEVDSVEYAGRSVALRPRPDAPAESGAD